MLLRCFRARLGIVLGACLLAAYSHLSAATAKPTSVDKSKTLEKKAAKDGFSKLSVCEKNLLGAAIIGGIADCSSDKGNELDNDPVNDDGPRAWKSEREVRSELVRWLVRKGEVDPRGIRIKAARIVGELDLSYLTIPFPLSFVQTHFRDAVNLEGATLKGYFECEKSRFDGDFSLAATNIAAYVNCAGARFNQQGDLLKGKYAINIRFAKVAGAIWLNGVKSAGPATLHGTQCRNLTLTNGEFADTVFLADMKVEGDVAAAGASFSSKESRTTPPIADRALIAINMAVTSSVILSAENGYLDFSNLKAYRFIVTGKSSPGFKLVLRSATIGTLRDEPQSWPKAGNLTLDGFVYADFDTISPRTSTKRFATERLEWVRLTKPESTDIAGLATQPYLQLAKNRKANGDDEGEKQVLIALEDDRIGGQWTESAIGKRVLGWTIGYGYRPLRTVIFILVFVSLGSAIFWAAHRRGLMIPTDSGVHDAYLNTGRVPEYYPTFNGPIYALETFLPLVDLGQSKFWKPSGSAAKAPRAGRWLQRYTWAHVMLGWFFTTIFVAGITGIIPR